MAFNCEKYAYDSEIFVGDENSWLRLGITSRNKDVPFINLSSSSSKFTTIAIPFELFSDAYEECLQTNTYYQKDLDELTIITRKGSSWEVVQTWGNELSTTTNIPHKDMLKLLQYCSRYVQMRKRIKIKLNKPLYKKLIGVLRIMWNLPRKLLKL
jgi:hypothetical protein